MAAIQVPSYPGDPTSASPVVDAHAVVTEFHLSDPRRTLGFTIGYYRSAADHAAGVVPVNSATYAIGPNPETRGDGAPIPSYAQVVASAVTLPADATGTAAFAIVERAVYGFLLALPEFAGATIVA